jgi:hypothetical protein
LDFAKLILIIKSLKEIPLSKSDFLILIFGRSSPKDFSVKVFLDVVSALEEALLP